MRVSSLVPSWTETLIVCGLAVAGRTRFCIHPRDRVGAIPVIGGTKDLQLEALDGLAADMVLLDKEENTNEMAAMISQRKFVSHVVSIPALVRDLDTLAALTENRELLGLARIWREVQGASFATLPVMQWIRKPKRAPRTVLYLIWRNPWVVVSRDTFIGDMLSLFGMELPHFPEKYPKINLDSYSPEDTLLLFSSEPFPFHKHKEDLALLAFPSALVDGEGFSWFGVRSLNFLQKLP